MTITPWTTLREMWVRAATPDQIIEVIAKVAKNYRLDENPGDATERAETILWLSTRGAQGREWGIAAQPARQVGGWTE